MRTLPIAASLLVLALAACGGGQRPYFPNIPPPPMRGGESERPPAGHRPPPPAHNVASPQGPAGPLAVARVGDYMDSLEMQLRHHLRGVLVARQGDAINLVIPNTALFSGDGGVNGDDVLEPLAAILRGYPHVMIQVNGFTDTAGKPEQNLAVSQKRARLIADALAHEGVPPARLSSQGFGETHLRFATGDDKNDPRNRRIEILLKAKPG